MPKNVAREAFDLVLEVSHAQTKDGEPKWSSYDVTECTLNFGLNRLPSANCTVAVGRNALTLERAMIHNTAESLVQNLPARIWLYPQGDWLPREHGERWSKAGPAIIFDGYVAGFGYRRSQGVTSPVVYLSHWLADLSFSSALSDQSHPGNPAMFRWPAISRNGVQTSAPTEFLPYLTGDAVFTAPNITEDFWGKSLHPMLYALSQFDILGQLGGTGICDAIRGKNETAQLALRRFETHVAKGDEIGTPEKGGGSPYHIPLSFKQEGLADSIARAVAGYFRRAPLQVYFNSTVWGKLLEFSAAFKFAIIPRVQTALVAPFVPGLRQTYDKVLDVQDVTHMESSAVGVRPLRAVGVLPGTMQTDILDMGMRPAMSLSRLGGCWTPTEKISGMLMYVLPPVWLTGVLQDLHEPTATVFSRKPQSATTPAAKLTAEKANQAVETVRTLNSYFEDHAHYVFAQEMLRGRYTMVQSKLRFDIAPGTNVSLRNVSRRFVPNDQLSRDYVGTVTKVGILLNATAPMAATTFQLDYTRTAKENEDERTSIDAHPLYSTVFKGAPLLHEYAFPE